MKLTKKYRTKYLFLFFLLCLPIKDVISSPWVTPDDVLVKHDLQILSDAGLLNIPINTWPIAWGDVAYNLKVDDPKGLSPETLLSLQRIKQRLIDEQMGGISANAEIKVAKNPDQIMTFFDPVNVKKLAGSSVSYMSKNSKKYPIPVIIGTIYSFFNKLFIYHSLENKNEASKTLGINPYFIEEYKRASVYYPMKRISKIFNYLLEADKRSKGIDFDATNHEGILNELIYKIFKN